MTEEEYRKLVAERKAANQARNRMEKAKHYHEAAVKRIEAKQVPAILKAPKRLFEFSVPGVPVPKARPRLGAHGNVYTPSKTTDHEKAIRSCAELAGVKAMTGPLQISIVFQLVRPESSNNRLPSVRPDLDNLAKTVLDALNGLAYADDAQIVRMIVNKAYGDHFITSVTIGECE